MRGKSQNVDNTYGLIVVRKIGKLSSGESFTVVREREREREREDKLEKTRAGDKPKCRDYHNSST